MHVKGITFTSQSSAEVSLSVNLFCRQFDQLPQEPTKPLWMRLFLALISILFVPWSLLRMSVSPQGSEVLGGKRRYLISTSPDASSGPWALEPLKSFMNQIGKQCLSISDSTLKMGTVCSKVSQESWGCSLCRPTPPCPLLLPITQASGVFVTDSSLCSMS